MADRSDWGSTGRYCCRAPRAVSTQQKRVLRSQGSTERVPPLHGSDSSFEDAPADLPLREDPDPVQPAGRALFGAYAAPDHAGPTNTARPPYVRIWLVAAVALVAGILIGFASGFTAGKRVTGSGATASAAPDASAQPSASSAFSEEAVREPVRVDEPPVVPEAAPPSEPARRVEGRVEARQPVPRVEPRKPAPVERAPAARTAPAPPVPRAPAVEPVASGQGSMQVVSRPAGAQVILDGRAVGRTPLSIDVPDGAHDIRLDLPGFRRWETSVEVTAGQRTRVAASLEQ